MPRMLIVACAFCLFLISRYVRTGEIVQIPEQLAPGDDCVDAGGVVKNHKDSWNTPGQCKVTTCYKDGVNNKNYYIQRTCVQIGDAQGIPDAVHCVVVSNSSLTFPDCCPRLVCSERAPMTTISPPVCPDLATDTACAIWKIFTNNCTSSMPGTQVYNYTQTYCRHACGIC